MDKPVDDTWEKEDEHELFSKLRRNYYKNEKIIRLELTRNLEKYYEKAVLTEKNCLQ